MLRRLSLTHLWSDVNLLNTKYRYKTYKYSVSSTILAHSPNRGRYSVVTDTSNRELYILLSITQDSIVELTLLL